jgi:NADH:ubiquinone oxidoreductase subunit H
MVLAAFVLTVFGSSAGTKRGMLSAAQAAMHQVPLLAVIVSTLAVTRSAGISDVVQGQGGWPQDWFILHDPAMGVIGGLAFATLVPTVAFRPLGHLLGTRSPRQHDDASLSPAVALVAFVATRFYVWMQAMLLSIVLLGGWTIPGVVPATYDSQVWCKILGTALLLGKTWGVVAAISLCRWALGHLGYQHSSRWLLRWGLPSSLVGTAISICWNWGVRHFAIKWADTAMHWAMLCLLVTALAMFAKEFVAAWRRTLVPPSPNTWI